MTIRCSSVHRATKLINLHDPLFTDNVVSRRSNDCNHALLSSYDDRTRILSSQRASAFITKAERFNYCKLPSSTVVKVKESLLLLAANVALSLFALSSFLQKATRVSFLRCNTIPTSVVVIELRAFPNTFGSTKVF